MFFIEAPPPISHTAAGCRCRRCISVNCNVRLIWRTNSSSVPAAALVIALAVSRSPPDSPSLGYHAFVFDQVLCFVERDIEPLRNRFDHSPERTIVNPPAVQRPFVARDAQCRVRISPIDDQRPLPAGQTASQRRPFAPSPAAIHRSPSNPSPLRRQSRHTCEIHSREVASTFTLNESVPFSVFPGSVSQKSNSMGFRSSAQSSANSSAMIVRRSWSLPGGTFRLRN